MKEQEMTDILQDFGTISNYFEDKPWSGTSKLLKEDFDINTLNTPTHYQDAVDNLEELLRESRILFLYSVFHKVCVEENKLYSFETPYQAGMKYDAVTKIDGVFYIQDEDKDLREIFTSEEFMRFIDDMYWELYQVKEE